MNTKQVDIYETVSGWTMNGRTYRTAASAYRALLRADKLESKRIGRSIATVLTWHTTTKVGLALARSFA